MTEEEERPVPEVNGHAEEVEEKEEVKLEQVKEKEAESDSNASVDTEVFLVCYTVIFHIGATIPLCHKVSFNRRPLWVCWSKHLYRNSTH